MNENSLKEITVDDFNVICRVCLQIGENMDDIFRSGVENQLMEITHLRVELDDELPKAICQKCSHQINQFFIFLEQAKASDFYLRSLLSVCKTKSVEVEAEFKSAKGKTFKKKMSCKRSIKRWKRKSKILKKMKNDLVRDKMYLIYVPEADSSKSEMDSEICIKDLNSENDNLELSNYCRTLVKNHFLDHTYPKEQKHFSDDEKDHFEIIKSDCWSDLKCKENKTYTVNLDIYKCNECKATFEEIEDLTTHFLTHEVEPSFVKSNFICTVCDFSIEEKLTFMNHLKTHKEEGCSFVKVNAAGEIISAKDNENVLFNESFTKECRVFCLNLSSLNCTVCFKNIQSEDNIPDHLVACLSKEKSEIKFSLSYLCPICQKSFTEKKRFIKHLCSHKEGHYYFIKVDNSGKPVQLEEDDHLFIPFEDALKLLHKKIMVFEIVDINSCDKCDYTSEFFHEFSEHYSCVHSEKISSQMLFCCPVCLEECKSGSIDENLEKFYEHLKIHKNEGVSFVLVKKNGTLAASKEKYSDIFTQSLFLLSLVNSSSLLFENISPKVVILDQENSSAKYICDICKDQFKKKQEIITHLRSHQKDQVIQENLNYICEKCGKKCSGKLNYKKHFLKHSKSLPSTNRRPICTICNKTFANRTTLIGHVRHHLKEGKNIESYTSLLGIICEKCGKSFSNNASLTKHKKMHLKEKENTALKCEICDRDFFRQSSFDRHKSAHLNPKYFECGDCKLPLCSVVSLQKHSEIHKNGCNTYDCRVCNISFLTKNSLNAHQTHTGHYLDRKPLECNVCHEKFFIGRKFTEHIKTHPKYKMGECTLCGKRLSTIQSLMLHMGRHFESNSILCPHCGKQFFEERNYHRHLLTHEGIKPFLCDTKGCKKSFYTLFELNRHKKYHNNTRDFRCPYCSKSFHEANHLTVHVRTHTGERPYMCPHCNKGFVTRTHCKHHIKLVHQGVGYDLIRSNISKKVTVFETLGTIV